MPVRVNRFWFILNKVDQLTLAQREGMEKRLRDWVDANGKTLRSIARDPNDWYRVRTCSLVKGDDWVAMRGQLLDEIAVSILNKQGRL